MDSLVDDDGALASPSIALGHDASGFDPDGPLPDIPETNASESWRERTIALARGENLACASSPLALHARGYSDASTRARR